MVPQSEGYLVCLFLLKHSCFLSHAESFLVYLFLLLYSWFLSPRVILSAKCFQKNAQFFSCFFNSSKCTIHFQSDSVPAICICKEWKLFSGGWSSYGSVEITIAVGPTNSTCGGCGLCACSRLPSSQSSASGPPSILINGQCGRSYRVCRISYRCIFRNKVYFL